MLFKALNRAGLFLILFFAGCKSFNVQTETFNQENGISADSFKFFNPQNLPKSNFSFSEENKKIIFDAIAAELKRKGYASHQSAGLLIKVQGGTVTEKETREGYPTNSYYRGGYYNYPSFNSYYQDISRKKTTIIIDVFDAKSNKILWQGVATGEMGKKSGEVEMKLKQAIQEIMGNFPSRQ